MTLNEFRTGDLAMRIRRTLWALFLGIIFCYSISSCSRTRLTETNAFIFRNKEISVSEASNQVRDMLLSHLIGQDGLAAQYPVAGHVTTSPDPADAQAARMHCTKGDAKDSPELDCVLLNQAGDFIRVMPITWQSAAFFMYRIYLAPRELFKRIDPAKDFVAIDVFLLQEPGLREMIDQTIRATAEEMGARPFLP